MLRIGHGFDVHRFGDGDHVMIGGVRIDYERGVIAHSDGDVLLHALSDALLGACALGDIGHHFPDTDARWAGADSRALLRHVVRLVAEQGYRKGVPMGADLPARPAKKAGAPGFLVMALKDPLGAHLERIQVVKGWLDAEGQTHEKVYDVKVAPKTGSTVDVEKASYTNAVGQAQFAAYWQDPDFDPAQSAFYYARVIEIPTPRWTAYDATRLGTELLPETPMVVQDRAYTSPIWYAPQ